MRDGRVLRSGPAVEVYRRPVDPWVAAFVGEAVFLPVTGPGLLTPLGPVAADEVPGGPGALTVMVWPERIVLAAGPGVEATVTGHTFHGHDATVTLRLSDGTRVTVRVPGHAVPVAAGSGVRVRDERAHLDR
ncbi:TOBE domain-containing protein [Nonomuraea sp. NPDC048826]|uniref:TOBE domain-containing protein n=1 Tax=Nonomuraea sp. NPDC048826 TaxID=3364347 RepID=UPI00371D836A